MLIFITYIYTIIPINSGIILTLASDPNLQMVFDRKQFVIKKIPLRAYNKTDPNIFYINRYNKKYSFDNSGRAMHSFSGSNKVMPRYFTIANYGFRFDIISTEKGQRIMKDGQCVQRGDYDEERKGYTVVIDNCKDSKDEYFEIKKPIFSLKDNSELNAQVFLHHARFNS